MRKRASIPFVATHALVKERKMGSVDIERRSDL